MGGTNGGDAKWSLNAAKISLRSARTLPLFILVGVGDFLPLLRKELINFQFFLIPLWLLFISLATWNLLGAMTVFQRTGL